ncbi:hypothetical protein GW756_00340 [bacterium]|nr:hypothetical protein [bacterium]NCQ54806.1 hypothetical protein [Candidatus Parcubacteria bacterium]NCS66850.1 hypothetical protein [Candidatus Peregrinibacteria bacterium]NCS95796.1 hypothetical protein [bacterium]
MRFIKSVLPTLVIAISCFVLGGFSVLDKKVKAAPMCFESKYQEIAIVELKALEGDSLKASINGAARLVWNEDFVEGDGEHLVALAQLPSEHDQDFRNFAYAGNAGTMKFYPSNTYAARGTEPSKRRFFPTKEAAIAAGFVASKLVK